MHPFQSIRRSRWQAASMVSRKSPFPSASTLSLLSASSFVFQAEPVSHRPERRTTSPLDHQSASCDSASPPRQSGSFCKVVKAESGLRTQEWGISWADELDTLCTQVGGSSGTPERNELP